MALDPKITPEEEAHIELRRAEQAAAAAKAAALVPRMAALFEAIGPEAADRLVTSLETLKAVADGKRGKNGDLVYVKGVLLL